MNIDLIYLIVWIIVAILCFIMVLINFKKLSDFEKRFKNHCIIVSKEEYERMCNLINK